MHMPSFEIAYSIAFCGFSVYLFDNYQQLFDRINIAFCRLPSFQVAMADFVRHVLEDMVPELEDLENRGYFNKAEIRQIVQKRQDFEYSLRRRAALKADFLRCIDYEMALERLRQLRRKERTISGPSTLADHCIVRRIHFIYERMLRKFRGDLSLWSRWLAFCQKTKSTRQTSKVLTRALQLHPLSPALWTYAASWEFETNGNAVAARALMQRGLRMCKDATALWHEYFRMELLYAARLVARRQVLGLTLGAAEQDDAAEAVLKGAVAKVVYNNAVAVIPGLLGFRARFLEILESVELPGKEELEGHILDDIASAFAGTPGAVDLEARRRMRAAERRGAGAAEAAREGLEVFEAALESASSPALWDATVAFIENQVQAAIAAGDATHALAMAEQCLATFSKAIGAGQASESIMLAWPRATMRLGRVEEALAAVDAVEDACAAAGETPAAVACQRISLRALGSAAGLSGVESATPEQLVKLIKATGDGRQPEVWLAALRVAVGAGHSLGAFGELLIHQQQGAATGPVKGGMGTPAAALFSAMWNTEGQNAARKLYKTLFALPLPGAELVHAVLDAELALAEAGGAGALAPRQLREVFESGVGAYGSADVDLWLRYLRFEQRQPGGPLGGKVHWRAVKALDNADAFVARAQLIQIGIGEEA